MPFCGTLVPERYVQFFKQQLRWKKSWVRETLIASCFMWKRHQQIVLGLLCDDQGVPLSIEVFPGNTSDTKTFASQVHKVAERFGGGEVTFVGDRGMIKGPQIQNFSKNTKITSTTSSAELFAPRVPPDGRFVTTASMSTARVGHTATVLANGLVLVTGGRDDSGALLSSAELYDPATGLWGAAGALE